MSNNITLIEDLKSRGELEAAACIVSLEKELEGYILASERIVPEIEVAHQRFVEGNIPKDEEMEELSANIVSLLQERMPGAGFIAFVVDFKVNGNIGFTTNIDRLDCIKITMEWITNVIPTLKKEDFIKILTELEEERWGGQDGN